MEQAHVHVPERMHFKGDIPANWKLWKQKFNLYLLVSGKKEKAGKVKIAVLLNILGNDGIQIYNTFEWSETEDKNSLDLVLAKFDAYCICNSIKNVVFEHYKFFKRDQMSGETIDEFITALKHLATTCPFKDLQDTLIRDRLVLRVRDSRIQKKLLQNPDLKLSDSVQICRAKEIAYFDDILVFGRSLEEHNKNLSDVLEKIKLSGLILNLEKSKICVPHVKFLGHLITAEGIAPDKEKTEAIQHMNLPKNRAGLQRFLGMIVYLAKFISNMYHETGVLRKLLSEKNEWVWTNNEQKCFDNLKRLVYNATTLSYYDPNKTTTLSVDASPYGLGAVILQDNRPIEFASVSLMPVQKRYNHIEKELLALVYGCERFSFYLFGSKFNAETDHRPL